MKKEKSKYVYVFLFSTVAYIIILLRGLPSNNYLDWPSYYLFGDGIELLVCVTVSNFLLLKWISNEQDYFKDSIWVAFFSSIILFIYDSLYLGIIKGFGFSYFDKFWFLWNVYFIIWIEIPITGYLMQKNDLKITKKHFVMLLFAIIAWLLNWWQGSYSNHYLEWALNTKIIRLTNILLILMPIVYFVLRFYSSKDQYFKDAGFLALYLSFIFIWFDFYYLGVSKGYGLSYIKNYWFLTLFYPIFWIEIPIIGWVMQRFMSIDLKSCIET